MPVPFLILDNWPALLFTTTTTQVADTTSCVFFPAYQDADGMGASRRVLRLDTLERACRIVPIPDGTYVL